jgi:ATP-dependent exoDNAse (exonuclease V) beta subunit
MFSACSGVTAAMQAEATRHAERLLDGFLIGPLGGRLAAIAPHVVARELALLAEVRGEDGFASTASGSIDLVYRDGGELVIVDFKTDAVSSAREAREAAHRHRAQMESYRAAWARALATTKPPRAELWFIAAGEIVVL